MAGDRSCRFEADFSQRMCPLAPQYIPQQAGPRSHALRGNGLARRSASPRLGEACHNALVFVVERQDIVLSRKRAYEFFDGPLAKFQFQQFRNISAICMHC